MRIVIIMMLETYNFRRKKIWFFRALFFRTSRDSGSRNSSFMSTYGDIHRAERVVLLCTFRDIGSSNSSIL